MNDYGKETILDVHGCRAKSFTRPIIRRFFRDMCKQIDMERCKLCWWDDLNTPEEDKETESHLVGTSAVQFIKTSNITIHTLSIMKRVYLNVFSCKTFDEAAVRLVTTKWFGGTIVQAITIRRI